MNRCVLFTLLLLCMSTVTLSFHYHKQLLSYLVLSQLGAQKKIVVLPLFIPVPIGLLRGLFSGRAYRYGNGPTEIYIQSKSHCQPFCGINGHSMEI